MSTKTKKKKGLLLCVILALIICLAFVGWSLAQRLLYPLEYEEIFLKYADEYGLDPYLVAGVIHTESRFQPESVSYRGAVGLMQIMPETGEWIAGKLGETYNESQLFDPETNIRYGCWYLRFLQDRYAGDKTLTLAGYNAGQGNVARWLENPEYSSDGKTLEVIPSNETSNYVQKVMTAYEKYQSLYDL